MTMIEPPRGGFVFFHEHPSPVQAAWPDGGAERGQAIEYLRTRERAERAAAKRATSDAARRVHQELAQYYARLTRQG